MKSAERSKAQAGVRDLQKQGSRAAVLQAAATLFAQRGFEGVAIADVAALSGVRKPNLLYHFSSKEALWKETVDWVFAQVDAFFDATRGAFAATELQARTERWRAFRALIGAYYEACRRYPAYVLIPMIEGATPSWRTTWIAQRHLRRHVRGFEAFTRALIADGLLPEVEPLHLQNMLAGGAQLSIGLAPLWAAAVGADTASETFLNTQARAMFALLEAAQAERV